MKDVYKRQRWHISLGSFFRDYVYIPLGGSRKGLGRTILNLFVVWALTGLWHGASWNFVLWGLYFFIFIALERLFLNKVFARLPGFVSHIYLLIVVYFGWILFRFKNMALIGVVLKGMFCQNGNPWTTFEAVSYTHLIHYVLFLPSLCDQQQFVSQSASLSRGVALMYFHHKPYSEGNYSACRLVRL